MTKRLTTQKMTSLSEADEMTLRYLTIRGNAADSLPALSLAPDDSDQVDNQTVLNALVATLVKFGSSGKIEPYLASEWDVENNGRKWTFSIREGFTCESGEIIDADSFRLALIEGFKRNIKRSDKTDFSMLTGWDEFIGGNTDIPKGLKVEGHKLIFNFDIAPTGLLNFLRMPYFGYWCRDNFESGKFKKTLQFISSGPYRVERFISKSKILLSMRKNIPSYHEKAPQEIEVGYGVFEELSENSKRSIYKIIYENNAPIISGFSIIDGPPVIMHGVALHTNSKIFSSAKNRLAFSSKFKEYRSLLRDEFKFSNSFYLTSDYKQSDSSGELEIFNKIDKPIRIAMQSMPYSEETKSSWEKLFAYIFKGHEYEIIYPPMGDSSWVKGILNNEQYDLRTASVYIGAHYSLSVIGMMFCSNLGISFPDPSGKVCSLVETYSKSNRNIDKEFENSFNGAIEQDNAVFPVFHARDRWLISSEININTMPTSIIHPLFEKIRFNE